MSEIDFQRWAQMVGMHWDDAIAMGFVRGGSLLSYGCTITDLDAADGQVLFYEGVLGVPTELSGDTVYVCSSSASDTGTYRIMGTDATGAYQETTVTATGTTPAAATGTWNHVQRIISTSATNVGTVYVSTDAGALPTTVSDQIQCVMPPGANYAINPVYVVPTDEAIIINRFDFSANVRDTFQVEIDANRQGVWIQNFVFYTSDAAFAQDFHAPLILREGDKMRVKVQLASGTGADGTFGMNGLVLRNDEGDSDKLSVQPMFEGL